MPWCPRGWTWSVLWKPRRLPTPKKEILFTFGYWNAKVGSQDISGVTGKFGFGEQSEEGQRVTEFCQENALVVAKIPLFNNTRQLYTWTSPNDQYWNLIDYILCSQRWKNCRQSAKTRPGADCGSDHQLLIAKFRLKLKKTGKNNRPVRYDLNQILYGFTVEVTNIYSRN